MISYAQWGNELYSGKRSYKIVQKKKYILSAGLTLILLSLLMLAIFRINPGIDFKGGTEFRIASGASTTAQQPAYDVLDSVGVKEGARVAQLGSSGIRVQSQKLDDAKATAVQEGLAKAYGVDKSNVSKTSIGATWGASVSAQALRGLIIFLVLVALLMSVYFKTWTMALAALLALSHDFFITIGVYAVTQVEVTPATIIGFLTILGYSLYDTVVVFDKVRENTANIQMQTRYTYDELVNLSVNQTMVRSINTSVVALLPVSAILFLGSLLLGAGTLRDISMPLFIGMIVGTMSSIFIASPLLTIFRGRREDMREHTAKVMKARQERIAAGKESADTLVEAAVVNSQSGAASGDEPIRVAPATPGQHKGQAAQPKRKNRNKK